MLARAEPRCERCSFPVPTSTKGNYAIIDRDPFQMLQGCRTILRRVIVGSKAGFLARAVDFWIGKGRPLFCECLYHRANVPLLICSHPRRQCEESACVSNLEYYFCQANRNGFGAKLCKLAVNSSTLCQNEQTFVASLLCERGQVVLHMYEKCLSPCVQCTSCGNPLVRCCSLWLQVQDPFIGFLWSTLIAKWEKALHRV